MDTDSDEEEQAELEYAVMLHKQNKKEEKFTAAPNGSKCEIKKSTEHQNNELSQKNTGSSCVKEWLNGDDRMSLEMQDLIKYFTIPKKDQKNQQEISKKKLRDYEKQGAIPKKKIPDPLKGSKKNHTKISDKKVSFASNSSAHDYLRTRDYHQARLRGTSLNGSGRKDKPKDPHTINESVDLKLDSNDGLEKTFSEPFFYIVPEKPAPNFTFPRGSYYVIPKTPDSYTRKTIIFHPENSTEASEFNINVKIDRKDREVCPDTKVKSAKNINNLGKDVLERIDSHLNIGPTQIREEYVVHNLEGNYNCSKIFEKVLISPEKSSEVLDVRKLEKTQAEGPKENEDSYLLNFEESDLDHSGCEDNPSTPSNEELIASYHHEVGNPLGIENLDSIIQKQFERMVRELPESRTSDLLDKCIEFQGNEEKILTYIQETQLKTRKQRLITDLQYIFPDADPEFLLEEIEKLSDDENAVDILTDKLLDSQSYPKISWNRWETKKKLWQTYVINFDVKNYLLKLPKPEEFAGAAGDNNKTDEKLIMEFLMSRYPTASEHYLHERFNSKSRNITKTCANLVGFEVVRLKESTFEQANFDENFLKEICYIDHREEIDNYLKTVKKNKELEATRARLDGAFLYCPLCSDEELIASEAITCPEGDIFCKECIKRYVETKIGDATYKFPCPMDDCDSFFMIPTLEKFLPENIISVVVKKQQAEEISTAEVDGLEFCPKCDFAYIPSPEDKIFKCQNRACLVEICRTCHEENHVPLRCEEIERQVDLEARKKIEETMTEKLIRKCPKCGKKFVKIDGCNLTQCVCGTKVCYICTKIIAGHDHFYEGGLHLKPRSGDGSVTGCAPSVASDIDEEQGEGLSSIRWPAGAGNHPTGEPGEKQKSDLFSPGVRKSR